MWRGVLGLPVDTWAVRIMPTLPSVNSLPTSVKDGREVRPPAGYSISPWLGRLDETRGKIQLRGKRKDTSQELWTHISRMAGGVSTVAAFLCLLSEPSPCNPRRSSQAPFPTGQIWHETTLLGAGQM